MNFLPNIHWIALALICLPFTGWSAPITYPNQAYIFSDGSFSPVPGFTNIKAFAVEGENVLGVTRDGHVIRNGGIVVGQFSNAVAVGLSYAMAAVLTADGSVIDLGDPSSLPQPPGLTNAVALDVFGQYNDDDLDHKLAVTSDGRVIVWGPYELPPPSDLDGVIAAAGGWSHVAALKSDGKVVVWGDNSVGQLNIPPGLDNVVAVAAGGAHTVALQRDGSVVAWGQSVFGQLEVPPDLSNVVAIAAAEYHSLALKSDGTLVAWGQSYSGGSVTPPADLSNVVAIAVSGTRNLALVSFPPQGPVPGIAISASSPGRLTLTLSGETNKVSTLETSEDLITWDFVQYVTNGLGSTSFEIGNTNAHQFFRAR